MQVLDLIRKYGWESIAILPTIKAGRALPNGNVWFVDSGAAQTLDANDGVHGHKWDIPLATIDYAIGLCTASNGDVILVAPGHAETLSTSTIDFDVAGVTCIGLGNGTNRPTITYSNAADSVDIGAANVTIKGLRFNPSVTDILIGLDIEASVTGTLIEDCEFAEGDDSVDEFITAINLKAGCDNTVIKDCLFRTKVASAGVTDAICLTGTSDNCIISGCRIIGNYSTAGIVSETAASTDLLIENCTIKVKDAEPGIECHANTTGIIRQVYIEATTTAADSAVVAADMAWFDVYAVTTDGTAAVVVGGGELEAAIEAYNLDHLNKTDTGVAADADLTTYVADGSVLSHIMTKGADSSDFLASTDSLEAISDTLTAGTTLGAGIQLDHLQNTTTGVAADADLSTYAADGSVLSHIMTKGADTSDYLASTDSLEAISDALAAGTGATAALVGANLDHLAQTAIADTSDPVDISTEVADNTVLADILTDDGDASDYDRRYHSIEALAKVLQIEMGYNLKSVAGSAMPIAIWYVDANIGVSGDGKTPATAFQTIQEAITACSNSVDDWILVFDYSGGGATVTIDKSFVHIIGNACKGMSYPRIKPATAVPGITFTDAGDRVEIANLTIGGGDTTAAAISFDGCVAGAYGNYIHDCHIGRDADAPCLDGILIPAGADAPYLVVEDNFFNELGGMATTGSAVNVQGNITCGKILDNLVLGNGTTANPAINIAGASYPVIEGNRVKLRTDTGTGGAITLGATTANGWVNGNVANDSKDAPANNPFVDGGSTNGWGINYTGKDATLPA